MQELKRQKEENTVLDTESIFDIYKNPKPTEEQLQQIPSPHHRKFTEDTLLLLEHMFPLAYTTNATVVAYKIGVFDALDKPMTIDELIEFLIDKGTIELDPLNIDQELEACKRKFTAMFNLFSAPQLNIIRKVDGEKWELSDCGNYLRNDAPIGIAVTLTNLNDYYVKPSLDEFPHQILGTRSYDDIGDPDFGAQYTERVPRTLISGVLAALPKFGINLDEGDPLVLDLGCGTGGWLTEVAKKHSNVKGIGLDYNLGSCEMGTKKADAAGLSSRLEFRQCDLATDRVPLSDNSVDLVTAMSFHHFFPGYGDQNVTDEIYRVLKPGGKYISVCYINDGPDDIMMLSTQCMFQFLFSGFTGWRSREHLHEIAQKAGFKITKIVPLTFRGRQSVFFAVKT
jgi:ubiquinone/menaquinone biosynthesis C-methylase UbiE